MSPLYVSITSNMYDSRLTIRNHLLVYSTRSDYRCNNYDCLQSTIHIHVRSNTCQFARNTLEITDHIMERYSDNSQRRICLLTRWPRYDKHVCIIYVNTFFILLHHFFSTVNKKSLSNLFSVIYTLFYIGLLLIL